MFRTINFVKGIRFITIILLLVVALLTLIWARLNLPHVNFLETVNLRHVSRISIGKDVENRIHIYDLQLACQSIDPLQLECQHQLANQPLVVNVDFKPDRPNYIGYGCVAQYGETIVPCKAYDALYTHGGLATPVVLIDDEFPLSAAQLNNLGFAYHRYSPYNLQEWLPYGYFALIPLLVFMFATFLWQRLGQWLADDKRQHLRRIVITMLGTICASVFFLFSSVFALLMLHIVD
ncbi:MAG: hypothetical protein AAF614_10805 [Chloroflexota bacterium]